MKWFFYVCVQAPKFLNLSSTPNYLYHLFTAVCSPLAYYFMFIYEYEFGLMGSTCFLPAISECLDKIWDILITPYQSIFETWTRLEKNVEFSNKRLVWVKDKDPLHFTWNGDDPFHGWDSF